MLRQIAVSYRQTPRNSFKSRRVDIAACRPHTRPVASHACPVALRPLGAAAIAAFFIGAIRSLPTRRHDVVQTLSTKAKPDASLILP